jgi:hypothetical protein
MELPLARELERDLGIPERQRCPFDDRYIGETGPLRSFELTLQQLFGMFFGQE